MRSSTPCERCGTKRFKKKSDGTMVCKNGHVLLGWTEETQDDELVFMGKRRKQKRVQAHAEKDKGRFAGADRDSVILQICQKGLNVLVEYCVREFGFPDDIQKIAQNLWELYIVSTGKSVTFDIFAAEGEEEEELQDDNNINKAKAPIAPTTVEDELGVDLGVMHENDDESKGGHDNDDKEAAEKDTRAWPLLRYANVIIFLFLTFKYARLPVLLSDVHRWCKTSLLPYMEILHSVPERIVRHLDKAFIYTFKYIPNIYTLYHELVRFRICYKRDCGVVFSDDNIPAIMHRLYPHFGLPDTFRSHAAAILERMQEGIRNQVTYLKDNDKHDDTQAVVAIVILLKFLYYFDDKPQGKRPRPLPELPNKDAILKVIRSTAERYNLLTQERDIMKVGGAMASRTRFLENLALTLKSAGYQPKNKVTFGSEKPKPRSLVTSRRDALFFPPKQNQDLGVLRHLDPTKAEKQIRASTSVYDNTMYSRLDADVRPMEYRELLNVASTLTGVDVKVLDISICRFEEHLKDMIA